MSSKEERLQELLFRRMKETNESQRQFAARLGISRGRVQTWCEAKAFPGWDSMRILAKEFGLSLDELDAYLYREPKIFAPLKQARSLTSNAAVVEQAKTQLSQSLREVDVHPNGDADKHEPSLAQVANKIRLFSARELSKLVILATKQLESRATVTSFIEVQSSVDELSGIVQQRITEIGEDEFLRISRLTTEELAQLLDPTLSVTEKMIGNLSLVLLLNKQEILELMYRRNLRLRMSHGQAEAPSESHSEGANDTCSQF